MRDEYMSAVISTSIYLLLSSCLTPESGLTPAKPLLPPWQSSHIKKISQMPRFISIINPTTKQTAAACLACNSRSVAELFLRFTRVTLPSFFLLERWQLKRGLREQWPIVIPVVAVAHCIETVLNFSQSSGANLHAHMSVVAGSQCWAKVIGTCTVTLASKGCVNSLGTGTWDHATCGIRYFGGYCSPLAFFAIAPLMKAHCAAELCSASLSAVVELVWPAVCADLISWRYIRRNMG